MAIPAANRDVLERRERGVEALVRSYAVNLEDLIARAQARTLAELQARIEIENGIVRPTLRTQTALRGVDRLFLSELEEAGLQRLLTGFTTSFSTQVPLFQESLRVTAARQKLPLEQVQFTGADVKALLANAQNAQVLLKGAVESAAIAARQNALLTVGGVSFKDLAEAIAKRFRAAASRSESLAKTAISTYYRLLTARTTDRIERALPDTMELHYRPIGPLDKLTRPFCRKVLTGKRTYTREEIERMNNGQTQNVFLTFGGYRCRHIWGVDSIKPAKENE